MAYTEKSIRGTTQEYKSDSSTAFAGNQKGGAKDVERRDFAKVQYKEEGGQKFGPKYPAGADIFTLTSTRGRSSRSADRGETHSVEETSEKKSLRQRYVGTFEETGYGYAELLLAENSKRVHDIMALVTNRDERVVFVDMDAGDLVLPTGTRSDEAERRVPRRRLERASANGRVLRRYDAKKGANDDLDARVGALAAEVTSRRARARSRPFARNRARARARRNTFSAPEAIQFTLYFEDKQSGMADHFDSRAPASSVFLVADRRVPRAVGGRTSGPSPR